MNGELPSDFETWNQFWAKIKGDIKPEYTKISWLKWSPGDEFSHDFTVEFVKAKCFDEIQENYGKVSDWDGYEETSVYYVVSKIDKLLCYKRPTQC